MPHVSVIIPTYNRAKYISRAVDSVLSQTYRDVEVVVVDDGSTDNTKKALEVYGDRIRYVYQGNAGPGAARNLGIRLSRGEYLAFLDSDDMWMPSFLEKTVAALDAHPHVDAATTTIYVGPADRKTEVHTEGVRTGVWRLPTHCVRRQLPFMLNGFWSGALLVRKEVVRRYGGFYERGCTLGEDIYLWIQVALNHSVYRLREPLAWYDTEASGLGFASGRRHFPLEPVLIDNESIWRNCPEGYRTFLSHWLACHALKSIHIQIATGDYDQARWLIESYPLVREWRSDWRRIRFKLAFPGVTKLIRRTRDTIIGSRRRKAEEGAMVCVDSQRVLPGVEGPMESASRRIELRSLPTPRRRAGRTESAASRETSGL